MLFSDSTSDGLLPLLEITDGKNISPLASKKTLTTVLRYSTRNLDSMSEEDLASYFQIIAEYKNVSIPLKHTNAKAQIHTILENYKQQVEAFSKLIKANKSDYAKLYDNLKVYRALYTLLPIDPSEYIVNQPKNETEKEAEIEAGSGSETDDEIVIIKANIQQILAKYTSFTLSEHFDIPAVHTALKECVNELEAWFKQQLLSAFEKYDRASVREYSADLPTLFAFVESIKDHYPMIHDHMKQRLKNNILSFITGSPDNYGWDVIDKFSILVHKRSFIPSTLWEECNITAAYHEAQAMIQTERDQLATLSIKQLTHRLFNLTHATYGLLVRDTLTSSIKTTIAKIRALFAQNRFDEAIIELNKIWPALQYFSQVNPLINSRWKCHNTGLSNFNTEVTTKITQHFLTASKIFNNPLARTQDSMDAIKNVHSIMKLFMILWTTTTRNLNNRLFATVFSEKNSTLANQYLTHAKNISDFLDSLFNDFYGHLGENKFAEVLPIWKLLRDNAAVLPTWKLFRDNDCDTVNLHNQITEKFQHLSQQALLSVKTDGRFTSVNDEDKKAVHRSVFTAYEGLKNYYSSAIYSEFNQTQEEIADLLQRAEANIQENFSLIQQQALDALPSELLTLDSNAYQAFNTAYRNLTIAQEVCTNPDISTMIQRSVDFFKKNIAEKLNQYVDGILATPDLALPDIILSLIKLKKMSLYVGQFKEQITTAIEKLLKNILNNHFEHFDIPTLGEALENEKTEYESEANMLLDEHPIFKSFVIALRNKKTKHFDIDYVCANLEANPNNSDLNIERIKDQHQQFQDEYWRYVNSGLALDASSDTTLVARLYNDIYTTIINDSTIDYPTKVVKLAACFFAYWSVEDRKRSNPAPLTEFNEETFKLELLQPHPAQIIGIFRLLGINQPSSDNADLANILADSLKYLKNHLAQIPTGEGKSIVMAVVAMVLASVGYDVDCACYSQYLTQRDFKLFESMFRAFNLHDNIAYATFNEFIERWIHAEFGKDLRDQVDRLIRGIRGSQLPNGMNSSEERQKILFMDELDIFFSKDFSGSTYSISHVFASEEIFHLIRFIWKEYEKNCTLTLDSIKENPLSGYEAILLKLANGADTLLDHAIKGMLEDVEIYRDKKGDFVLNSETGQIGYKPPHDHVIQYNVVRRYQTMFAYMDLVKVHLYKKIGLLIKSGEFSYAEMLKRYKYVLGLTGTLSTLDSATKLQLESLLEVSQFTYMPSVYGDNSLEFPHEFSVTCVFEEDYFKTLTKEIKKYRGENSIENEETFLPRPVMVFLKSTEELSAYYKYLRDKKPFDDQTLDNLIFLDEKVSNVDRDNFIARATLSGGILLATSSYGRGVDFICKNQQVNERGGPHVVMGYFPEDKSEETQLKGRTKRQGGNGSVSMVLNADILQEKYESLDSVALERERDGVTLYSTLDNQRTLQLEQQHAGHQARMSNVKQRHDSSMALAEALTKPKKSPASSTPTDRDLLRELSESNKFKTVKDTSSARNTRTPRKKRTKEFKTVCLIDATGSMQNTLNAVKNSVDKMYGRTRDILQQAEDQLRVKPVIMIQFVFYRNYNSPLNKILEISPWYTPNNYADATYFLNTIVAKGGFNDDVGLAEAAEVAFAYVNRLREEGTKVDQVMWIGDIYSNPPEETDIKRKYLPSSVTGTAFETPVYFNMERQKIINAEVSIHSFCVDTCETMIPYSSPFIVKMQVREILQKNFAKSKEIYKETAELSGGEYGILDPSTHQGAEDLAHAVTKRVLGNIGGKKLEEAYVAKYQATYTSSNAAGRQGLFTSPRIKAATTSSSNIEISREEIRADLNNYLNIPEVKEGGFFKHRNGRINTRELLKKLDNSTVGDTEILADFEKWREKGKIRSKHAAGHVVFEMNLTQASTILGKQ
jgi:hypothetical protein